jgi:hypothetical protein
MESIEAEEQVLNHDKIVEMTTVLVNADSADDVAVHGININVAGSDVEGKHEGKKVELQETVCAD